MPNFLRGSSGRRVILMAILAAQLTVFAPSGPTERLSEQAASSRQMALGRSCGSLTSQAIGVFVQANVYFSPLASSYTALQPSPYAPIVSAYASFVILSDDPTTTLANLPAVPPVTFGYDSASLIHAQSSNPSYQSCDYKLADSSADQPILQAAEQAMVNGGLATWAQLDDPATIFMASDVVVGGNGKELITAYQGKEVDGSVFDSLAQSTDPGEVALYSELDGYGVQLATPTPNTSIPPVSAITDAVSGFKPVSALINPSNLLVEAAGFANFAASS